MIARNDENNDQMNLIKDAIESINSSKLSHEIYCASVIGFDGSIITKWIAMRCGFAVLDKVSSW
jgi:hypothetical protein